MTKMLVTGQIEKWRLPQFGYPVRFTVCKCHSLAWTELGFECLPLLRGVQCPVSFRAIQVIIVLRQIPRCFPIIIFDPCIRTCIH